MSDYRPVNQETFDAYNREPGIVVVDGSNYQREMAKWEQFHSKYTGSSGPGNPWVYRAFPKMVYKAERYPGTGQITCMAAPPDPMAFRNPGEFAQAEELSRRFTEKCQRIVNDERELQQAMEAGWRNSPEEAVAFVEARDRAISQATAERNYEDRNMSDAAKREIAEAVSEAGGEHLPEIKRKRKD